MAEIKTKICPEDLSGKRLDAVLPELFEGYSRSFFQKMAADGRIYINGAVCTEKKAAVNSGDEIKAVFEEQAGVCLDPENIPLDIIYEDDDVIVINKQRGLVVHPGTGNESSTLVNALLCHCGDLIRAVGDHERPGIVHRIDKDTSGLIVAAKTKAAYDGLRKQFDRHSINRTYIAAVYNSFQDDSGKIDLPIGRDPENRLKRAVNGIDAKHAVTYYKVMERIGNYNVIEARLETGRTHQIRVHMAFIGHPLLGDTYYGPKKDKFKLGGQMLHARDLGFVHPVTHEELFFTSEPPEYFTKAIKKLERLK